MSIDHAGLLTMLGNLPADAVGATPERVVEVLQRLDDEGFEVEAFYLAYRRVYRATDPETGERQQVATVPGAVTDWRAVTGVAYLWKVSIA